MKILMILNYYFPYVSGLSIYTKHLSEGLVKRGHTVTVLTSQHDRRLKKHETIQGVTVIRCPYIAKLGKGVIMPTFMLNALYQSKKHDIVNIHLPLFESGLLLLAIKHAIITYHCDLSLGNHFGDRIVEKLYYGLAKLAVKRTRKIVTSTEDYASQSVLLKKIKTKCSYIFPPIQDTPFKYQDPSDFKARHGLDTAKIVGFVGRIVYEKGLPYLLDSIPHLKKRHKNIKIVCVGDYENVAGGSTMESMRDSIAKHQHDIKFLGPISDEDLPLFYSACDVLVLPSIDRLESFGMVQVEAMLCGTPVVASDLPGVRQPVIKTGMGLISRVGDADDLAKKILMILDNRDQYVRNRNGIKTLFSIENAVQAYEQIYRAG